jgi:hypothetical protein
MIPKHHRVLYNDGLLQRQVWARAAVLVVLASVDEEAASAACLQDVVLVLPFARPYIASSASDVVTRM